MSSLFGRWFAYGLGKSVGKAIFGEEYEEGRRSRVTDQHIRQKTEAEILEDERRFDEEARRYAAEDAAARAGKGRG